MISLDTEVCIGDNIVIESHDALVALGYEKDDPEILEYADKSYEVCGVIRVDSDLKYYAVNGTNQLFIDADVRSVRKKSW